MMRKVGIVSLLMTLMLIIANSKSISCYYCYVCFCSYGLLDIILLFVAMIMIVMEVRLGMGGWNGRCDGFGLWVQALQLGFSATMLCGLLGLGFEFYRA